MNRTEHTHFLATFFSLLVLISVVSTGFAPGVGASPDPENTINADESSALSGKTVSQTEDIDAEIVDITHDSGVHKDGDPVRVTVTVENTGSEANRFYIGFSVRDPSGDWLNGDDEASLYLRPGDKSTTDVIWYVDDDAESGMYDSRVSAWEESDPDNLQNRVADNQKSDAFEVETESKKYQLTADANGDGGFEVYPPGLSTTSVDREYEEGTTVELTATAGPDSQFVDWTGDVDSIDEDDATIEVTMDEAYDITANFEKESQEYRLEADPNGNGGFEVYPPGFSTKSVDRTYEEGTTVELTATPDSDSQFVEWTGDVGSVDEDDATIGVTMDEPRDITAEFEEVSQEYRLEADSDGNGGFELYPPGLSTTSVDRTYEEGTTVELTATPDSDSQFVEWSGDIGSADRDDATIEVKMNEAREITATFEEVSQDYRLEADSNGDGGFEVYPPGFSATSIDREYEEGTTVELTATPGPDSRFVEWTGDIGSTDSDKSTIEVTMNEARDITANFEEVSREYRLEADADGDGGFEVYPPGFSTTSVDREYEEGTSVELTAAPGPDSRFVEWTGDIGSADSDEPTIEVTMSEARDITAVFEPTESTEIDAEIVDVSYDSGVHRAGDPVRTTVTLKNTGSEANRFYIGFDVQNPSGTWLDGDDEASVYLRPGDRTTTDVIWYVDDSAESGMYDARVSAWEESDPENLQTKVADNQQPDAFEVEGETEKYQLSADTDGNGGFEVYPPGISTTVVDREYEEV